MFAIIDVETTGLSAHQGCRIIEVAVVLTDGNSVTGTFQSLCNPGTPVPAEIQRLTGISTAMLRNAPDPQEVIPRVASMVKQAVPVAHNAQFDRSFLMAEMSRVGIHDCPDFLCTLLTARRLYPWLPNHRLGTLVSACGLSFDGDHHRALADAAVTAKLLRRMRADLAVLYPSREIDEGFLRAYQRRKRADAKSAAPWLEPDRTSGIAKSSTAGVATPSGAPAATRISPEQVQESLRSAALSEAPVSPGIASNPKALESGADNDFRGTPQPWWRNPLWWLVTLLVLVAIAMN